MTNRARFMLSTAVALMLATGPLAVSEATSATAEDSVSAPGAVQLSQAQETASYDSGTLEDYASAMVAVMQISEEMHPQIAEADDEATAEALWNDMQARMVGAVESEGLTVEEYNQITEDAQANPQLAEEIRGMVETMQ